ncbi:MAG: ORF6N domain-containing protein [Clostridia bacterium]|nr:ORF6N domain-containing protein [Clostridia bacterium]
MENELQKAENNSIIEYTENNVEIKNLIYTIRGKQVMLDSDLAMLFNTETRSINQAVKRNIERFPDEFGFQLSDKEFENLRSQFVILNLKLNNGKVIRKYNPYVFTEEGIIMLSSLLRSEIAIKVSLRIVETFVEMRKFLNNNGYIFQEISNIKGKLMEHDKKFDEIFNELQHEENIKQKIFFEGQIYDAYSLIIDIFKKAKNKITIIDNYIDDSILKMLSKKNKDVEVVILTSTKSNIQNIDIQKFNKEYPTLKVAKTNKFHDRFIVIDNKELYHCGASIKDLGNKCFGINKIEDSEIIENFINKIIA